MLAYKGFVGVLTGTFAEFFQVCMEDPVFFSLHPLTLLFLDLKVKG